MLDLLKTPKKRKILIDGDNVLHTCQSSVKLHVNGFETQAVYGFLNIVRQIKEIYANADICVLWDGYSWRYSIYKEYKANRNKIEGLSEKTIRVREQNKKSVIKQKPHIISMLAMLGIEQCFCSNYEADDLAAYLSSEKSYDCAYLLVSADKDWLQLIKSNVTCFDVFKGKKTSLANFEEVTGYKNTTQFVQSKALIGDAGDNIKGIKGIGPITCLELFKEYGTIEKILSDYKGRKKPVLEFINSKSLIEDYKRNIRLVSLSLDNIPSPEKITYKPSNKNLDGFFTMCKNLGFLSILNKTSEWAKTFGE